VKKRNAFLNQFEIQSTFLPHVNLARIVSSVFSWLFLIRLSSRLCVRLRLIGFIEPPSTITALGFFLGMARPPALCSPHPEADGVGHHLVCGWSGPFSVLLGVFFGACPGEKPAPTAVSLPVCARVRPRINLQIRGWLGFVGEQTLYSSFEAGLIVFF